jgi:cytochrome P450
MLLHRKILQPPFSKSKVSQFQPFQRKYARMAVKSMLQMPEKWDRAVRRFAVAVVLNISYAIELQGDSDPYIKIADDAASAISNAGAPASSIVDRFPASMSSHDSPVACSCCLLLVSVRY